MKTIFENKIKLEISQAEAEKIIQILSDYLENCEDILTMKVYIPLLESLEEQFDEQKLK